MPDRLPREDFVGRSAELAVFDRLITDARDARPSLVLVGGDGGIGKTTIVREAASLAGTPLYLGRSTHIGGDAIPLAPLADLLRQVRRSTPELLTTTPALAPLLHWFAPGTSGVETSDAPQVGLFAAVLELFSHLTSNDAVVIGFEDLHWADTVTWDLFEYLARNVIDERVVLVGTYRANEVAVHPAQRARLAELARLTTANRIMLSGLTRDEVAARVTMLMGRPAPSTLVDQVLARGQGNPFFTSELVAAHLAGETIPIVLSDLISAEIAGLDDDARHVLGAVATIGRETSHDLLAAVVALPEAAMEAALRKVIDARLLIVDHDAYRFRHPLIGEVVYADLLPPQRQRLHRKIAETAQLQSPEQLRRADRAGELAFHLDRSGDSASAFVALLAAADAAEVVAPGAAYGHLERAFELWDVVGDRAATAHRGERLWQAADIATSTVSNDRAVELARAAFAVGPPRLGAPWGHERLGRYLWASGMLDEARVEFERAAALLTGEEGAGAARVYAGLGQAELMAGRYATAAQWCTKVFEVMPTSQADTLAWSMAHRVLGVVRTYQGDPDAGVELCRKAVDTATSAQARTFALVYLCVALVDAGQYEPAIDIAVDAVAEGQLIGLHGFGSYFDSLAAEALTRLGRWPDADAVLERHRIADTYPAGLMRLERAGAMLAARRGDTDRARRHLAAADALPIDGWHQSLLDAARADVHLALGNWDGAATAAQQGWDTIKDTSVLWAARFAMLAVSATVERTLDQLARREALDVPEITRRLQQQIDHARSFAERSGASERRDTAAHLAHATASLSRLRGSDVDAWAQASARWADLGDRWMTATALLREAEAAASQGAADRAAASLRRAHTIASEIGAAPLLEEIGSVSTRTRISIEAPTRVILDESSIERLGLTPREAEVLALVAAGRTNRQIGTELYVSDKTASVHVSNILRKLGVSTRVDAAAVAQRLGIV